MFDVDINNTILVEQRRALEAVMSANPDTEKALRKIIRKVILEVRNDVVASFKFKNGDPRKARQSVRSTVYKQILGANINIYSSRKAHSQTQYEPAKKLRQRQRGGNRLPRSRRTQQIMGYGPLDRGFILRFLNNGTSGRMSRYGNRGSIAARHFFQQAGEKALMKAADKLADIMDNELADILNSKTKN